MALRREATSTAVEAVMAGGAAGVAGNSDSAGAVVVPVDDLIDFSHHEDTDHFLRPALKVPSVEARDVRDGQSGGFVVGHVERVCLKSER